MLKLEPGMLLTVMNQFEPLRFTLYAQPIIRVKHGGDGCRWYTTVGWYAVSGCHYMFNTLDGSGGDPYSLAEYEADDLCTYVELA